VFGDLGTWLLPDDFYHPANIGSERLYQTTQTNKLTVVGLVLGRDTSSYRKPQRHNSKEE
jgi:hypothetical protein